MTLANLRPGMGKDEVERVLRQAGLALLPAAQNYCHVLLRDGTAICSPNGHPLRIDLGSASAFDVKTVRALQRAYEAAKRPVH